MSKYDSVIGIMGTIKYYLFIEAYYRFLARFGLRLGVAKNKKNVPLVVSLTSIAERFEKLHICIESLLRQSLKPDHLILWLEVPLEELPPSVRRLVKRGLEIRHCKDIGPYKKAIYSLREFPTGLIVTADDDVIYPEHWLQELFDAYQREPQYIHCHRAHYMEKAPDGKLKPYREWRFGAQGITGPSLNLFPTGVGGVLYPPECFSDEILSEQLFMRLCPRGDDIWYKAMSLKKGVLCKKVRPFHRELVEIKGTQTKALWKENTAMDKNDRQIKAVFDHFDLYPLLET